MAEEPESLVLQQLCLIREELAEVRGDIGLMKSEMADRMDGLEGTLQGQTAILIGLGQYIGSIDQRVERLEAKIGA